MRDHRKSLLGFSIVELVVVIAIVLILLSLVFPNIQLLVGKAEKALCISKMRGLWYSFSSYLQDGEGWPQVPSGIQIGSVQEQEWWLNMSSEKMGLNQKAWSCPVISRSVRQTNSVSAQACRISYLPTLFDSKPATPMLWPRMPWFTEIGNAHEGGNLSIRTDGSVCPAQDH